MIKYSLHIKCIFTARNEVGARLCFYRCSVILFTGGVPDTTPRTR